MASTVAATRAGHAAVGNPDDIAAALAQAGEAGRLVLASFARNELAVRIFHRRRWRSEAAADFDLPGRRGAQPRNAVASVADRLSTGPPASTVSPDDPCTPSSPMRRPDPLYSDLAPFRAGLLPDPGRSEGHGRIAIGRDSRAKKKGVNPLALRSRVAGLRICTRRSCCPVQQGKVHAVHGRGTEMIKQTAVELAGMRHDVG